MRSGWRRKEDLALGTEARRERNSRGGAEARGKRSSRGGAGEGMGGMRGRIVMIAEYLVLSTR